MNAFTLTKRELAQQNRNMVKSEIDFYCKKYLSRPSDFGYHGDLDLFKTWSLGPIIETRDSTLIDQSNSAAIQKMLEQRDDLKGLWEITHCGHWAVGWCDHLSFKVCTRSNVLHTEVIKISPMVEFWESIQKKLDDYPLLDEDDYSNREYEATLENIKQEASYMSRCLGIELPEDYESILFDYFWDNDQSAVESSDDMGGYPSDSELTESFQSLGWIANEG